MAAPRMLRAYLLYLVIGIGSLVLGLHIVGGALQAAWQNMDQVVFEAGSTVFFSLSILAPSCLFLYVKERVPKERLNRLVNRFLAFLVIFMLGAPFVVKSYAEREFREAGYVRCSDHPVYHEPRPSGPRLFRPQVWVKDAATCLASEN
jgi:glucan phosphoethanolaminetransferase (alkaline phosphatase superfamily)